MIYIIIWIITSIIIDYGLLEGFDRRDFEPDFLSVKKTREEKRQQDTWETNGGTLRHTLYWIWTSSGP